MTEEQKIDIVVTLYGGTDSDEVLSTYLSLAEQIVLNRLYPFGIPDGAEVPARYELTECEICCYLLNKRGAEGETSHNENGLQRSYESGSVPKSLLNRIIPFAAPIGGGTNEVS